MRKERNRIISFILAIVLCISCIAPFHVAFASARASGTSQGISWSVTPAVGGGYDLTLNAGDSTSIPSNFLDDPALSQYKDVVKRIVIGSGITAIQDNAFLAQDDGNGSFSPCAQLKTVEFAAGSTLAAIGAGAFSGCQNLTSINLDACTQLTTIGGAAADAADVTAGAFYHTGLTQVTIPASVNTIGDFAFYGCTALTKVNFVENTNPNFTMGAYVFAGCTALETINPENLQNENLVFGVKSSVTFGSETITDGNGLFYGCTALKALVLPNMSGSIAYLCKGCSSLTSLNLDNCTKLNYDAGSNVDGSTYLKKFIDGCSKLEVLDLSKTGMSILWQGIVGGFQIPVASGVKKVILPPTLVQISGHAFRGSGVEEIVFPENSRLKAVGGTDCYDKEGVSAFQAATRLKELNLQFDAGAPQSELFLQQAAFIDCSELEKLTISSPNGLAVLGAACFKTCENLHDLIWDVKSVNLALTWDNYINDKTSSDIRFKVGPHVQKLPSYLIQQLNRLNNISEYAFAPNHSFYIDGAGSGPFTAAGCYYADDTGSLYRLYADNTAELVYASRSGSGELTIPATLSAKYCSGSGYAENAQDFTVTKVGSYAFQGTSYSAVTFEAPQNITALADNAFAGAYNLSNVNGSNKEEEINNIFSNLDVTIGSDLYKETKITKKLFATGDKVEPGKTGTTIVMDESSKLVQLSVTANSALFTDTTDTRLATGEGAEVSVGVSYNSSDKRTRVYVKVSDPESLSSIPEGFVRSEEAGVFYYDVPPNDSGEFKTYNFSFSYPNNSAPNKQIALWLVESETEADRTAIGDRVVEPDTKLLDESDAVIAAASKEYLEVTWDVQPEQYGVTKEVNPDVQPAIRGNETATLESLSYLVENTMSRRAETIGADYVDHVVYEDTLTLPEGLSWRADLSTAEFTCEILQNKKGGSVLAQIDGTVYTVCTLNLASDILTGLQCSFDDTNPVVTWTMSNEDPSKEITAGSITVTYGPEVIVVGNPTAIGELIPITNTVVATPYYTYNGEGTQAEAVAKNVPISVSDALSLTKEWVKQPAYMGEEAVYRITAENVAKANNDADVAIYDRLDENQYIDAGTIQQMLESDAYDSGYLTIEIQKALLMPVPDAGTVVTAVDGKTVKAVSVSDTAQTPLYNGRAEAYTPEQQNVTITIQKGTNGNISVSVSAGEGLGVTTYPLTDGKTLQALFDEIGYVVSANDKYVVHWDFPANTVTDTHKEYLLTARVKNSLQSLTQDLSVSKVAELQNPDSFTYKVSNRLYGSEADYVADANFVETEQINTRYDLSITKTASVDGVQKSTTELAALLQESVDFVVEYKATVNHYGSGAYGLLPVVDHMEGIQAVLAEVEDNTRDGVPTWAEFAETTTIDGKAYYVLNANNIGDGKEYVYKGVWLENGYADSVTVTKTGTDSGLDTLIKWYYYDDAGSDYTIEPVYKAICSQAYAGNTNTNLYRSIDNEVWVNDLPTHRLWDCIGAEGTVIVFDKQIVTGHENDDNPDNDTIWSYAQPYPIRAEGTTVTYRLDFENFGSAALSLTAEEFFDLLPETLQETLTDPDGKPLFIWDNSNVQISYLKDEDVSITYNEMSLSGTSDGSEYGIAPVQGASGAYELKWKEGFAIEFPARKGAKAYIYVQLKFPTGEAWSQYVSAKRNSLLLNTLNVHGVKAQVSHTLPDKGEAMLRKGVYETGYYVFNNSGNAMQYFRGADRLHYVKTAPEEKTIKNTVTYFVTLYNSSETANLYLSTIYDRLPEGFEFCSLVSNTSGHLTWDSARNGCVSLPKYPYFNVGLTNGYDPPLAKPVAGRLLLWWQGLQYNMVSAKVLSGDDQNQMLAFDVITQNQDERGYYLKPGEALQFGYMCFTGNADVTEAVNTCAMEYLDYSLSGVALSEDRTIKVSESNGLSPENNGEAQLWGNDVAASNGFTETNPNNLAGSVYDNASRQWLASSVSLTEGNIKPDINKSVESAAVKKGSSVSWTVTSYNNGTNAMTDYTIEDVMDSPFVFTGEVGYAVSSERKSVEWPWNGNPRADVVSAGDATRNYLFNIQSMDENGVAIVSNRGAVSNLAYNTSTDITVSVKRLDNVYSDSTITVCFTNNPDGSICMSIGFHDSVWSIPANGSGVLTLSTMIPEASASEDGVYINKARLTPVQTFDSADVTNGKVEDGSVVKQAQVSIYSDYASAAYKEVWEVRKQDTNYGVSPNQMVTESPDYILLDDKTAAFTYRLNVSSDQTDIHTLVLIDNLPQPDDVSPVSDNGKAKRDSDFKVDFASNPNVVVEFVTNTEAGPTAERLKDTEYTVQYSDKANITDTDRFGKTTDWQGAGEGWYDTCTETSRSIRIVIRKPLPQGTIARVSFDAVIAGGGAAAAPGAFAWNNFGYNAQVSGGMWLYSAPSNVGVGIPEAPSITKKLVDSNTLSTDTLSVPAKGKQSFRFLIYKNSEIAFTDYALESMQAVLDEKNIAYTLATVTVDDGQSAGKLVLDPSSGVLDSPDWTWEADAVYTIVEVEPDSGGSGSSYTYGYIEAPYSEGRSYTFTYQRNVKNEVVFANAIKYTALSVNKTVTGAMGNKSKDFAFKLDLKGNNYQPKYINYTRGDENGRIPVQEDGTAAFTLSHGETIVFTVPVGLSYRVYETDADGYETTYELTEGATATTTTDAASGTTLTDSTATVAVVNNRDGITPTSADTNTRLILAVMALVLLFASVYSVFRIRHKRCV